MGPSNGRYYIRNPRSNYFLTQPKETGDDTKVITSHIASGVPADAGVFTVQKDDDGIYSIASEGIVGYVAAQLRPDAHGNRRCQWQTNAYKWQIDPSGNGDWKIHVRNENTYWFDHKAAVAPLRYVTLKANSTGAEFTWQFIAAA